MRVDLQNSPNPRIVGTGEIVPQTLTLYPAGGTINVILFDNTQIIDSFGEFGSYYTFNFIYQGTITSVLSYRLLAGTFDLSNLTPCIGSECIGAFIQPGTLATFNEIPDGLVNGANTIFTLSVTPQLVTVWDNFPLVDGVGYTISGKTITFTNPPQIDDVLYATGLFEVNA